MSKEREDGRGTFPEELPFHPQRGENEGARREYSERDIARKLLQLADSVGLVAEREIRKRGPVLDGVTLNMIRDEIERFIFKESCRLLEISKDARDLALFPEAR